MTQKNKMKQRQTSTKPPTVVPTITAVLEYFGEGDGGDEVEGGLGVKDEAVAEEVDLEEFADGVELEWFLSILNSHMPEGTYRLVEDGELCGNRIR